MDAIRDDYEFNPETALKNSKADGGPSSESGSSSASSEEDYSNRTHDPLAINLGRGKQGDGPSQYLDSSSASRMRHQRVEMEERETGIGGDRSGKLSGERAMETESFGSSAKKRLVNRAAEGESARSIPLAPRPPIPAAWRHVPHLDARPEGRFLGYLKEPDNVDFDLAEYEE